MSGSPFARHHSMASPRDLYDAGAPAWRMPSAVGAASQVLTIPATGGAVAKWAAPTTPPPTVTRVVNANTSAIQLQFDSGWAAPATAKQATYNTTLSTWPTVPGVAVQSWDARVGQIVFGDQPVNASPLRGFSTTGGTLDVDLVDTARVWYVVAQVTAPAVGPLSGWATAAWDGTNYWVQFDGDGLDVSAQPGGWTMATFGVNFHYLKYDPVPAT